MKCASGGYMSHTLKPHWQVISVAFLIKEGRLLLGLRPSKKKESGEIWEFPGGTVEKGEQPEETLVRELKEELDIEVSLPELALCLCSHKRERSRLIVFFYVHSWAGEIKNKYHDKLQWFSYEECLERKAPNINPELFDSILPVLSKQLKNS